MISFPITASVIKALSVPEGWLVQYHKSESNKSFIELLTFDDKRKTILDGPGYLFSQGNNQIYISTTEGYFLYENQQIVPAPTSTNLFINYRPAPKENFQITILRPTEDPMSLAISKLANATHGFVVANLDQNQWQIVATQTPPICCFLSEDNQTICLVEKNLLTVIDNPLKIC